MQSYVRGPSNLVVHVVVGLGVATQPLLAPKPPMSDRPHWKWILDLLEERDVNGDPKHNRDYLSNSDGESFDRPHELEQ